jgi:membrane protein
LNNLRKAYRLSKTVITASMEHDVAGQAAQLSYYTLMALFPFLTFVLALFSYSPVSGADALTALSEYLPDNAYVTLESVVQETVNSRNGAILSLSLLSTLWLTSSGVDTIIKGLNKAYQVKEQRPFWKTLLISAMSTIFLAVCMVLSLVLFVFGALIIEKVLTILYMTQFEAGLLGTIRFIAPLCFISLLMAGIYIFLPNVSLKFREVIPGAILATIGWFVLSLCFSFYVNNFNNYSVMYGSIGGVIVMLIWMYMTGLMVLLGGELNAAYNNGSFRKTA